MSTIQHIIFVFILLSLQWWLPDQNTNKSKEVFQE